MKNFLILILVLFTCTGFAQVTEDSWRDKYLQYSSSWNKPLIAMLVNQDKYFPGDTVWFSVYFLFDDMKPVPGRQLLDIDLVDSNGISSAHFLMNVNDGKGANQMVIPASLSPGFYNITAYSPALLNFGSQNIFRKEIQVVTGKQLRRVINPSLEIDAEGGHIIAGLPNHVVLHSGLTNEEILISDDAGSEVAKVRTNRNGFSSLTFIPVKGKSYYATFTNGNKRFPFPQVEALGCALKVTPAFHDDSVRIQLEVPSGSDLLKKDLFLVFTCSSNFKKMPVDFSQDNTNLMSFPGSLFPLGIIHLSVLDVEGIVYASRRFFNGGVSKLNVKLSSSRSEYHPRETTQIELNVTNNEGKPVKGDFAIRVKQAVTQVGEDQYASSLVPGGHLLKLFDDETMYEDLDRFYIGQANELPWRKILDGNFSAPPFEYKTVQALTGTVYSGNPGTIVSDHTKVHFLLQNNRFHYETFTLGGKVRFTLPAFSGRDEIFWVAETASGEPLSDFHIVWDQHPVDLPGATASSESGELDPYAQFMQKKRAIDESYKYYATEPEKQNKYEPEEQGFEELLGGADVVVRTRDYVIFSSVEDMIKEVIPTLYHRRQGGKSTVGIRLNQPMAPDGDPVYIIDEIATMNTDFFLSIKPADIIAVKIVKDPAKLIPFGILGKNGFVIVETKMRNKREPLTSSDLMIDGQNESRKFVNLDYSGHRSNDQPVFRSTVFWSPSVKLAENGKTFVEWYGSDDTGSLCIQIEGLTSEGLFFFEEKVIKISLSPND